MPYPEHINKDVDRRHNWRILQQDKQFPPAQFPTQILFKACKRCRDGDLTWDVWLHEWSCAQCGHIEWEIYTADPVTRRPIRE